MAQFVLNTGPVIPTGVTEDGIPFDLYGSGSPEGVTTAPLGSVYRRTDGSAGTSVYFKETGAGDTGWVAMASGTGVGTSAKQKETFTLPSVAVASAAGTYYVGGFYNFGSTAGDFTTTGVDHGTANGPYGAYMMFVCAAATSDDTSYSVTLTGTSITDAGVRTASDTEIVAMPAIAENSFYQSTKKWVGQVNITETAVTVVESRLCNYGFVSVWDNEEVDLTLLGAKASWHANGAHDLDIQVIHHNAANWTYVSGGPPTHTNQLISLATIYDTEYVTAAQEDGSFRNVLAAAVDVDISAGEGLLVAVATGATDLLDYGQVTISYTQ